MNHARLFRNLRPAQIRIVAAELYRRNAVFGFIAAFEYVGESEKPALHKEPLIFDDCKPSTRSYK